MPVRRLADVVVAIALVAGFGQGLTADRVNVQSPSSEIRRLTQPEDGTQSEQTPPPSVQPAASAENRETPLPVRRVVLYKTGVGYFEHHGRVRGNQDVPIRFTSGQLNDVLKSLAVLDLGNGRIAGISYNSVAPLSQRLASLRLPLDQNANLVDLLGTLRGARVEVSSRGATSVGRLLGVEPRMRARDTELIETQYLSLITAAGDVRMFELTPDLRVRLLDDDLRGEVAQYLDVVGSTREQDTRRMVIQAVGTGARDLVVSYVSEVPVWKSTYRLILPDEGGTPLLQGWAIVDNTIGEDWNDVTLALVAGAPQTFVQPISQPYYTQRPVVPMPRNVLLSPQTHQGTLASGPGVLRGVVRDIGGGVLPGVHVSLSGGSTSITGTTDAEGQYRMEAPAGVYRVEFSLAGFRTSVAEGVTLGGGIERRHDVRMEIGRTEEMVTVTASTPFASTNRAQAGRGSGRGSGSATGGTVGGIIGGLPAAPPPPPAPAEPMAQGADLGDLFEYRITGPVTIPRNQSALVPILSAKVDVEKVSLWSGSSRSGRPLRAVWLTNTSGLTLDGGSFSVVESGAFAGEGLLEPLQPGERRLLSYAADLGVLVSARPGESRGRVVRIRAADGIISQQTEQRTSSIYSLRNEDSTPRVVVVEHPLRAGWNLGPGAKPAETSPGAHRFRVPLEARQETTLEVHEVRAGESTIALSDVTEEQLVVWQQAGVGAADLERALRPLLDKQQELAGIERRLNDLTSTRQKLVEDQQRLRENMKALRGSDEERQLLRRYTAELNAQEDRLAELERTTAAETARQDKAEEELFKLIASLSFEFTADAGREPEGSRPDLFD